MTEEEKKANKIKLRIKQSQRNASRDQKCSYFATDYDKNNFIALASIGE